MMNIWAVHESLGRLTTHAKTKVHEEENDDEK